ncbi:hypothetical protein ACFLWC_00140 [Chloroflexota bacterium]
MAEEVNQKDTSPELQSGDQSPPEAEELEQSVISKAGDEVESPVAQENEELAKANARLIELEQVVGSKDAEVVTLKQANDELEGRLTGLGNSLAGAVAGYKDMVVQANPEVIEELISGDTIESINESLSQAKALVSRVRQGLETEISLAKVPVGAPERTSPDLSTLSPREKIQYAIGKMR